MFKVLVFNFISSCLTTGVSVSFNRTDYHVSESEGEARVCVQMTGFSATPLTIMLTPTAGGSATGACAAVCLGLGVRLKSASPRL